jgi:hypothetical protein
MPNTNSVLPLPEKNGKKEKAEKEVNGNSVLQRLLQQLTAEERREMILRCDELPLLQGNEEEIQTLFSDLLQMILHKKGSVPRLFLHIHCKAEAQEPPTMAGRTLYTVQFNSNIAPCADWMQEHRQQLARITALAQKHNGSFEVADAQGCVFSLSLPGKSL